MFISRPFIIISVFSFLWKKGILLGKDKRFAVAFDCNDARVKAMFKDPYFKVYDSGYSKASNIIRLYFNNQTTVPTNALNYERVLLF